MNPAGQPPGGPAPAPAAGPARLPLALAVVLAAAALGLVFQDRHYRLDQPSLPADQRVIDHRDSPYTGMTWVASASNNYLQLRFFEMVEGGISLGPDWAELAAQPGLAHLRPEAPVQAAGPGSLNNSAYISMLPAGVLLNKAVPSAPRILVVGLGSGIGIAHLAHHFPEASIEVVDIDPEVITMVRDHYPLLAWLEGRRNAAGEPRLAFVARDARAHIRDSRGRGLHLMVLDAYTAGSTIPPHLMTREFFAECAATLADGGVVLANIIGCYGQEQAGGSFSGAKRLVLGGALRTLRAAGLAEAWVLPVLLASDGPGDFAMGQSRNNIVVAARHPLAPARFPEGWARLRAWQPYPGLATGRHVSRQYQLIDQEANSGSTFAPAAWIEGAVPETAVALRPKARSDGGPAHTASAQTDDRALIGRAAAAVLAAAPPGSQLRGWRQVPGRPILYLRTIDWTLFPRETWRATVAFAREDRHDPDLLVGPPDGPERASAPGSWHIIDAPLFTDQSPNADIVNR